MDFFKKRVSRKLTIESYLTDYCKDEDDAFFLLIEFFEKRTIVFKTILSKYYYQIVVMDIVEVKVNRWKEKITGVIYENKSDFIVLKEVTDDFFLDGVVIVNMKYVRRITSIDNQVKKYVINEKLKLLAQSDSRWVNKESIDSVLNCLFANNILFQIGLESSDYILVGYIENVFEHSIRVSLIDVKGEFFRSLNIRKELIRTITIDNEYLVGLLLYMRREEK